MFIPPIDSSGTFTLKKPYDRLITEDAIYTCRSLRSLNEFIALGDNVYDKFYAPLNVDLELFQKDLKENVKIACLQAGTGEWVYVPCSFIEKAPESNGVKYVPIVLGVSLGAVPDTFNLEFLLEQIKQITLNAIGIDPVVKAVLTAHPAMLSHEEHERLESIRKSKITYGTSDKLTIQQLQKEIDILSEKNKELERYIKSKL